MNTSFKLAFAMATVAVAPSAFAEITLYADEGFRGPSVTIDRPMEHLRGPGFDHRFLSAVVTQDRWEACEQAQYGGRCIVLRPGRYPSLDAAGIGRRISSIRDVARDTRIEDSRYAPLPLAAVPPPMAPPDYRRRGEERIFDVPVTSVHAVVGPPEQRCWMERTEVAPDRSRPSVGGAVAGALIGGILGHQVGRGGGQDLATAGGAIAGGVVGANVGRSSGAPVAQDVQRCENVQSQAAPSYWDVTYNFRGVEHRIQMSAPPGPTILVNERGEPRA
jgi:uncharacterized protein YcfJ